MRAADSHGAVHQAKGVMLSRSSAVQVDVVPLEVLTIVLESIWGPGSGVEKCRCAQLEVRRAGHGTNCAAEGKKASGTR